jgi:serine/threonine-protein phosphatase 6 regulatory ankyrin repeat subunit B
MNNGRLILIACVTFVALTPMAVADNPADVFAVAGTGDAQRLDTLLTETPALCEARDADGQTPLHVAAQRPGTAAVEVLLKHGAKLDAVDGHQNTALHAAVRALQPATVKLLLDKKADSKAVNNAGTTPLHQVLLVQPHNGKLADARKEIATALLAGGANVNAANKEKMTPLHLAAVLDQAAMTEFLLGAKADVAAVDEKGRTALHWAALYGRVGVIESLVKAKSDVAAADKLGDTPLHCAARRFRVEAARYLVAQGAKVDVRNAQGATPLILVSSAEAGHRNVDAALAQFATVLLDAGADVNAKDNNGATALKNALEHEHTKLAEALRARGAKDE